MGQEVAITPVRRHLPTDFGRPKSYKALEYFNIIFPCPLFSTFLYFLLEQVEKSILMENASIFLLSLNYDYF